MSGKGLLIFVVDDERVIAETLTAILRAQGFEVEFFTRPAAALEAVNRHAPDLLISDVVMPEVSGVDLAIRLRLRNPESAILLFSGQAATADLLADAARSGYDFELLQKPIHPKDLLNKVDGVFERLGRFRCEGTGRDLSNRKKDAESA